MTATLDRSHALDSSGRSESGLRRDLRIIFAEGVTWSIMIGLGETYLAAFALALGVGEVAAGLVGTWPLLAGGLLQLITPIGVRRLGSRRRWVVACAVTQAASFIPLIVTALLGHAPLALLFLVASVYWAAGMAAGPAWNTWVGTLVPASVRAGFFARRSRATYFGTGASFFVAGLVLAAWKGIGTPLIGFAILFGVAALARAISALLLARQSEAQGRPVEQIVDPRDVLRRIRHGDDGRLLLFLATMTAAVTLSSPFFTPFMLRKLELGYSAYAGLIGTAFLSKILALFWVHRLARRIGARRLLRLGAAAVIPISGLWILSDSYVYLLVLQVLSGTAWSMYEPAAFLMLFEAIAERERTSLLTTYNLVHTVATFVGSSLGGLLLLALPEDRAGYHAVFGVSTAARLMAALFLLRLGQGRVTQWALSIRALSVRPSSGGMVRPIWSSIKRANDGEAGASETDPRDPTRPTGQARPAE